VIGLIFCDALGFCYKSQDFAIIDNFIFKEYSLDLITSRIRKTFIFSPK